MDDNVTVIDIVAQVTDETSSGADSAERNVTRLEKSLQNLQKKILSLRGKSKLEVVASLKDMASEGIQKVATAGKSIAGKVWTVTMKAVDLVTAPFKSVLNLITSPIAQAAAFAGVSFGLADTISTYMDFEYANSQLAATMGKTVDEITDLTETAKEMGATTAFSATEAAEGLNILAMAGLSAEEQIAAIPNVLNLAAAGSLELSEAASYVVGAVKGFSDSMDNAQYYADIMAKGATLANTSVGALGEALSGVSSTAASYGQEADSVTLSLLRLAEQNVTGSEAITALNGAMRDIYTSSDSAKKMFKQLGVTVYDSSGNARDFNDIINDLSSALDGMSNEERSSALSDIFTDEGLNAFNKMAVTSTDKLNQFKSALDDATGSAEAQADTLNDNLTGSFKLLQSAVSDVQIAAGEKLAPYIKLLADTVTEKMPAIKEAVSSALDFVTGKIDGVIESVKELTASPEWKNAETLGDKIKLAWNTIIAEPFNNWWNSTGKTWLAGKAAEIGEGLGTALHNGILGILGIDTGSAVEDGVDIGKSFADAFLEGFNAAEVGDAIVTAIKNAFKGLVSDAATLLPGGEESSSTSGLSAALLGYGALKVGTTAYKGYKAVKGAASAASGVANAVGDVTGINTGIRLANTGMAEYSELTAGNRIGMGLANAGSKVAAAAPIAAGIGSAIWMAKDAATGVGKAEEWTGSNSTGAKVASGIGAAIGGTGNGILSDESTGKKALNVGAGALKGAGLGAAIGSVIPVVGTAVGAGVGAGVGALGAAIGGSNIASGLSKAGGAIKGFFTETVPEKVGEFAESAKGFFTESVPNAVNAAKEKISTFFTETIPEKFGELKDGITEFFTEQVPYAIGYAAGKLEEFFTVTVPEKFNELKDGVTEFFTEQVPAAIDSAKEKLETFFTETIPGKFNEIKDGLIEFFTEKVPEAISGVGERISGFFTETIPGKFNEIKEGIGEFFTEKVPEAIDNVKEKLTTFFTETIPAKFKEIWDGVVAFFTEKIPGAIASIGEGISGFFDTIKNKITSFFSGVKNKVSSFLSGATESANAGYTDATTAHAEGGIMTTPHVGLVAEDGAEAIIPLSGKRRERGIELWEQAGNMLGVPGYAEGDIIGAEPGNSGNGETGASGGNVSVTVQEINLEVNVNGAGTQDAQELAAAIREQVRGMTDDIAYQLAAAIQQTYANTPTAAWR